MTPQEMVKEFHEVYGIHIENTPLLQKVQDLHYLRTRLLEEEFGELMKALQEHDIIEIADALGDLAYVIYGTAVSYGIPLDEVFAEIHRSNMSKVGNDGKPIYREDGKVLKGPNFSSPNIESILYP